MENPEKIFSEEQENTETEPKPLSTFFIVRHGESEYIEQLKDPETQTDLTKKGKKQAENWAKEVEKKLEPQETAYIMQSPRVRAQETAAIAAGIFKNSEHNIVELGKGRASLDKLKDVNEKGEKIKYKAGKKEEYLSEIEKILEKKEKNYYLKLRQGKSKIAVTEDIEPYKNKVLNVLTRLIEITREKGEGNKKLFLFTHSEWLDTILEEYFQKSIKTRKDQSKPATSIEIKIYPQKAILTYGDEQIELKT